MIHKIRPKNFTPVFEIVSCFFEFDNKILLLRRHKNKSQGGRWGVPAGKINAGENKIAALIREIQEETGNTVSQKDLIYFKSIYVKHAYDFVYHMYHYKLPREVPIKISDYEHKEYKWVDPKKALNLKLVDDLDECIKMYYFNKS
ncbi:MAG: NUDIX hydrolase [Candidatus Levybacteria bacterium]|nr:NUDIX hydrolase [Candidatus Levybacteria bacterium]